MTELRLRKRHRMRQKEIESLSARLKDILGTDVFGPQDTVDMAEAPEYDAVFVNGKILAMVWQGEPFLTVRGLLGYPATKRYITVDMGAVRFVANGADVMGPGVVEADPGIVEGDFVWIRDVRNKRPLAIGKALVSADTILRKEKGKVASSLHYVGDKLWMLDEPKEEIDDVTEEEPA